MWSRKWFNLTSQMGPEIPVKIRHLPSVALSLQITEASHGTLPTPQSTGPASKPVSAPKTLFPLIGRVEMKLLLGRKESRLPKLVCVCVCARMAAPYIVPNLMWAESGLVTILVPCIFLCITSCSQTGKSRVMVRGEEQGLVCTTPLTTLNWSPLQETEGNSWPLLILLMTQLCFILCLLVLFLRGLMQPRLSLNLLCCRCDHLIILPPTFQMLRRQYVSPALMTQF